MRPAVCSLLVCSFLIIPMLASEADDDYWEDQWEEFDELVETGGYVDKTPLIKYFISERRHLSLIAPPKLGRTTNQLMMRRFFEVPILPIDDKGKPLRKAKTWDETIFKDLAVCKDRKFCDNHFSKYPVIYLDFKDINVTTGLAFYHSIRYLTTYMFMDHDYLRNSKRLSEKEVDKYIAHRHPRPPLDDKFVVDGGWLLSVWLHKHFNQSVVVLIDNIDHPANVLLEHHQRKEQLTKGKEELTNKQKEELIVDYKQRLAMIRPLQDFVVKLVRGNDRVHHSIFICSRKVPDYLDKEMTSLVYTPVLKNEDLSPYYGFSDAEIKGVLKKFKRMTQYQAIKMSLDKYRTGDNREVFSAFSMHDYMEAEEEEAKKRKKQREKELGRKKRDLQGSAGHRNLVGSDSSHTSVKENPTFEEVVRSGGYVDKTLLMQYFISEEKHLVVLAPRQFGKSLNIDMLRKFFAIKLDVKGQPIFHRAEGTVSLRLGHDNMTKSDDSNEFSIFSNLAVCQNKNFKNRTVSAFCSEHYAAHPVIFLDFHDIDVTTEPAFYNSFRAMIHKLYQDYDYLLNSVILEPEDFDQFKDYRYPKPPMSDEHVAYGPYVLSRLLATHFNTSCMAFIDNFDAPVAALMQERDARFQKRVMHTLTDLAKDLIKKNKYLKYSMFSALDFLAPSNLDELKYVPVLEDREMSQFYGFREEEIKELLRKLDNSDVIDTVKMMFDGGYRVKDEGTKVYRMFPVMKFLEATKGKRKENETDR